MSSDRVDLLLKYALAVAARQDYGERELGAIHLIKYVYLGDLAFAEENEGRTFTGVPWRFYHFGPWAVAVYERIEPVVRELGASEQRYTSSKYEQDAIRWSLDDPDLASELERNLPSSLYRAMRRAVQEFGSHTAGLLEFVYRTRPMLEAAPDEVLSIGPWMADHAAVEVVAEAPPETPRRSRKAEKRHQQALREKRESIRERLRETHAVRALNEEQPPPRYDELFFAGQRWLDSLVEPIEAQEGEVTFDSAVWKSQARKDSGVSR